MNLETLARDLPQCKPHIFFGPRVWEQLRQSITAKFGGADALEAALKADQAGVQGLVVSALGLDDVDYCLTAAALHHLRSFTGGKRLGKSLRGV